MAIIKVLTSQAKTISHYNNLRTKVMKCCANIYFNRQCLKNKIIPVYAKIKIPYTSPASATTQKEIETMRLKDEIKFLYNQVVLDGNN
jgi:hypothetical protein